MAAHAVARRLCGTTVATMSAYGGNAKPALAPASNTPAVSQATSLAIAISDIPPAAATVASASGSRGPVRTVRGTTAVLATRYPR